MYNNYDTYLKNITEDNIKTINFKNNNNYNYVLEHVSREHGEEYLKLIESEFDNIDMNNIIEFANINDNYGEPIKNNFISKNNIVFESSPTSLRYIYHGLLILNHYKEIYSNNKKIPIVEVGCGYGGLFLSINYFSKLLNINIEKYFLIDIDTAANLIELYLEINKNNIHIDYKLHSASLHGSDVNESELYLISNYCFTEIDTENRNKYISILINRCINGFITWQTVFGYTIDNTKNLLKKNIKIEEEKPQTSYNDKNYFVRF
jgi:hypothetical protein